MSEHETEAVPTAAQLTEAFLSARDVRDRLKAGYSDAEANLLRAADMKARALGAGKLVEIEGLTYRARAPRKPRGGEADPNAMWTLERVQVST